MILKFCISFKFFLYQITENSGGFKAKGIYSFAQNQKQKAASIQNLPVALWSQDLLHVHTNIQALGWEIGLVSATPVPFYQESKSIPRHSQRDTTSFSFIRMMSLGLFSKAYNLQHSHFCLISLFLFFFLKEGSGCDFWVRVVHDRNNTYWKRSDTEATLRMQNLCRFLETFGRTLDFIRV